jgi:hypothetical protein
LRASYCGLSVWLISSARHFPVQSPAARTARAIAWVAVGPVSTKIKPISMSRTLTVQCGRQQQQAEQNKPGPAGIDNARAVHALVDIAQPQQAQRAQHDAEAAQTGWSCR